MKEVAFSTPAPAEVSEHSFDLTKLSIPQPLRKSLAFGPLGNIVGRVVCAGATGTGLAVTADVVADYFSQNIPGVSVSKVFAESPCNVEARYHVKGYTDTNNNNRYDNGEPVNGPISGAKVVSRVNNTQVGEGVTNAQGDLNTRIDRPCNETKDGTQALGIDYTVTTTDGRAGTDHITIKDEKFQNFDVYVKDRAGTVPTPNPTATPGPFGLPFNADDLRCLAGIAVLTLAALLALVGARALADYLRRRAPHNPPANGNTANITTVTPVNINPGSVTINYPDVVVDMTARVRRNPPRPNP